MCHSDDSRPPAAPGAVPAGPDRAFTLTSADGTRVLAHEARAAASRGVGVVVLPDVRGLHEYYRQLAVRFAEAGLDAVAIDWFGRTAPDDGRAEGFDFWPLVRKTSPDEIALDVAAAVAHLRSPEGGAARAVFTLGFCFGGGMSWRQAADQEGLAGAIGFYGRPSGAREVADRVAAPLLMLMAGADQNIPVPDAEDLAAAVREGGHDADLVVFDGMPHSFFDRSFADHAPACDEAWEHVLGFVERHAGA